MTPFPPFGRVFIVGVSSVAPSLGVNGFGAWGGDEWWGIAPPAHLTEGNNPLLGGTTPSTNYTNKAGINKPIAGSPRSGVTPP